MQISSSTELSVRLPRCGRRRLRFSLSPLARGSALLSLLHGRERKEQECEAVTKDFTTQARTREDDDETTSLVAKSPVKPFAKSRGGGTKATFYQPRDTWEAPSVCLSLWRKGYCLLTPQPPARSPFIMEAPAASRARCCRGVRYAPRAHERRAKRRLRSSGQPRSLGSRRRCRSAARRRP